MPHLSPSSLKLRMAMEQRQRRYQMEQLLHSDNPVMLDAPTPSSEEERSKFDKDNFGPRASKRSLSHLKETSSLQYIVNAVDQAILSFQKDPDNFQFYTLILEPTSSSCSASTITFELLPIVCEYVNSRLPRETYNLQNISIPTLRFNNAVSAIVTETLLSFWIVGNGGLQLKNLYFSPNGSKDAAFSKGDYRCIIEALNENRMRAMKKDRQEEILQKRIQKAVTELEWTKQQKNKKWVLKSRSVDDEEDRDPALIAEVELQGMFGRIIQSESQRRYRLMQIELDEMVPLIVGMKIGAKEIAYAERGK